MHFFKNAGWNYLICNKGFRLTPPSCVVCDISDYSKSYQYNNIVLNLIYYKFLSQITKNSCLNNFLDLIISKYKFHYNNFSYHVLCSPTIETEFKIEGSDNRIFDLKKDMLLEFIDSKYYKENFNYIFSMINKYKDYKKIRLDINKLNKKLLNFYNDLSKKTLILEKKFKFIDKFYPIEDSIFKSLDYDILLFITSGCYKFVQLFINEKNYEKVMFWDFHVEKIKNNNYKLYKKDFKNRKVLIIDSVYSGKTLKFISEIIRLYGGFPLTLGVFPKSKYVIRELDYVLILNKIYKTSDLDIKNSCFFEKLYIDTFK